MTDEPITAGSTETGRRGGQTATTFGPMSGVRGQMSLDHRVRDRMW
ncbi:hypothetical protein [Williamsia limnetica]|nr:hypothetical protein [Williamsia limnetica]